jgi:hypothetical protein
LRDVSRHVAEILHLDSADAAHVHVRHHRGLIPLRYDAITAADMLALCAAIEADLDTVPMAMRIELGVEEMALL